MRNSNEPLHGRGKTSVNTAPVTDDFFFLHISYLEVFASLLTDSSFRNAMPSCYALLCCTRTLSEVESRDYLNSFCNNPRSYHSYCYANAITQSIFNPSKHFERAREHIIEQGQVKPKTPVLVGGYSELKASRPMKPKDCSRISAKIRSRRLTIHQYEQQKGDFQ